MKVVVCSREQAVGVVHDKPWGVISIRNPGDKPLEFTCPNNKGVLLLDFHDADKVEAGKILFSMDDARKVWDFIQGLGEIDTLLVHCIMGLSRSPGIAAAVDKVLNGDDMHWFSGQGGRVPNRRVYRCMMNVAHERNLI